MTKGPRWLVGFVPVLAAIAVAPTVFSARFAAAPVRPTTDMRLPRDLPTPPWIVEEQGPHADEPRAPGSAPSVGDRTRIAPRTIAPASSHDVRRLEPVPEHDPVRAVASRSVVPQAPPPQERPTHSSEGPVPGALLGLVDASVAHDGAVVRVHASPTITLYGTSWCGYCREARSWLASRGLAFVDRDVDLDGSALARLRQLNARGSVPTLDVDGEVLVGFSARALERLIGGTAFPGR